MFFLLFVFLFFFFLHDGSMCVPQRSISPCRYCYYTLNPLHRVSFVSHSAMMASNDNRNNGIKRIEKKSIQRISILNERQSSRTSWSDMSAKFNPKMCVVMDYYSVVLLELNANVGCIVRHHWCYTTRAFISIIILIFSAFALILLCSSVTKQPLRNYIMRNKRRRAVAESPVGFCFVKKNKT